MRKMKQWLRRAVILPIAAVCALLVPITAAQAALVTYAFTGNLDDPASSLLVSGSFQFESTTIGSSGVYNGAVKDFILKFFDPFDPDDAPIYVSKFKPGANAVMVSQDIPTMGADTIDRWELVSAAAVTVGDLPGGFKPLSFDLRFDVLNGNLNTSLQDPPSLGSLGGGSATWRLLVEDGTRFPSAYLGSISALTAVPLPAAVLLFGAGLISLVGLGAGGLRNLRGPRA